MRVLYDHQIFQEQNFGGVSRYFMELCSSASDFDPEIAVRHSDNLHLLAHPELRKRVRPFRKNMGDFLPQLEFRGKGRLYDLFSRISHRPRPFAANLEHSLRSISAGHFDVFHPTYYDPYFLKALGGRPFVVTVFDMIHEIFPEYLSPTDPASQWKRLLCEKAARIIAISHTTKRDLIEHYRVDPGKIDVVYLASSLSQQVPPSSGRPAEACRYLLFTGTRLGYKNFFFLAAALSEVLIRGDGLQIVCGGPPFSVAEKSYLKALGIDHLVCHQYASDSDLARLYSGAEAFISPSLYEGFGMPTLEAFACRCPALLSDIPAFREIAADAAIFFHPKSVSELRTAVERILDDPDLRRSLVNRGAQRAKEFSWISTRLETAEAYRRALDGRNSV